MSSRSFAVMNRVRVWDFDAAIIYCVRTRGLVDVTKLHFNDSKFKRKMVSECTVQPAYTFQLSKILNFSDKTFIFSLFRMYNKFVYCAQWHARKKKPNPRATHILDIKSTFYDMHLRLDAKRGIMQTRVLEKMRAEGSKTPFHTETERTVFGER